MATEAVRLQRIARSGPWRGLAGMTGAEVRRWIPWRSLVMAGVGLAVLAAVFAIWWFAGSQTEANYRLGTLLYPFFAFWAIVLTLVVAAAAAGAVAGEVDEGTAAWLIGMPVGRPAFIAAKVIGAIPGLVAAVFATGLIAYPVLSFAAAVRIEDFTARDLLEVLGAGVRTEGFILLPSGGEYVGVLAEISLFLLVLVALMVMLGTLVRSQGIVLGVGVVTAVALFVLGLLEVPGFVDGTPAGLISGLLDTVQAEPAPLAGPLLVSLTWIVALTGLAVLRFRRREL